jgi:hypothetical protein
MTPSGSVLVVSRHGGYALELRRAGLIVTESKGLDVGTLTEPLSACVLDAVAGDSPAPAGWDRLLPVLTADDAPPVLAVVSRQPPQWLEELGARALLVSAPISGRELAARVAASAGAAAPIVEPVRQPDRDDAPEPDVPELELPEAELPEPDVPEAEVTESDVPEHDRPADLVPAQVIDLTDEMDRDDALAVRRAVAVGRQRSGPSDTSASRGLSMPLRMARLDEVVDRLVDCLHGVTTLRGACEDLADMVDEQLGADVAVLVSRKPDAPWSVLAGVGLRPLEWRPVPRDPQVLSLLSAKRPILRVEASDDVRQSAADLPCASRSHLLVARHPAVDVLVIAGREQGSFTRDDVRTLGQLLEGTGGWDDALTLCALAERLLPYLDA